jgi:hypothetical protein
MPLVELTHREAEGDLPHVCVRCGAPAAVWKEQLVRLYNTRSSYGRGGVGALVRLILDLNRYYASPQLIFRAPFCDRHRDHWTNHGVLFWVLIGLAPLVLITALALGLRAGWSSMGLQGLAVLLSTVCVLGPTIVWATAVRNFTTSRESVVFANVGQPFIDAVAAQRQRRQARPALAVPRDAPTAEAPQAIFVGRAEEAPTASPRRAAPEPDDDAGDWTTARRRRPLDNSDRRAFLIGLAVIAPLALATLVVGVVLMSQAHPKADRSARKGAVDPPDEGDKDDAEPPEPRPAPPPAVPGKTTVDLVPLIDPKKDVLDDRKWEVADGVLRCKDGSFVPKIQLPYRPPEEYDFVVTFSQRELRNGVALIMPHPNGGSFFWLVGAGDGTAYGFHGDDRKWARSPGLLKDHTAYTTVVQVRRDGVRALLDGKELARADYRDLKCDGWRTIKDKSLLGLACDDPTVFHFVRVVEVTGAGKKTR